jgi:hypothetical protein
MSKDNMLFRIPDNIFEMSKDNISDTQRKQVKEISESENHIFGIAGEIEYLLYLAEAREVKNKVLLFYSATTIRTILWQTIDYSRELRKWLESDKVRDYFSLGVNEFYIKEVCEKLKGYEGDIHRKYILILAYSE